MENCKVKVIKVIEVEMKVNGQVTKQYWDFDEHLLAENMGCSDTTLYNAATYSGGAIGVGNIGGFAVGNTGNAEVGRNAVVPEGGIA